MNKICTRILISLDALLDTRSGALFRLDSDATSRLLKSRYYAGRVIDDFPGVDMAKYKAIYDQRDKRVLKYSSITNTVGIVHDFVQRVMNKNLNAPVDMDVEVHLNIHPYKLTDNEKKTLIIALGCKLPLAPNVIVVDYSLDYLNPIFVKNTYNTMVMYDFFEWLEIHSANKLIEKHPVPEVTIFTPALLKFKDETTPTNLAEQFTNVMTVMQPFINVLFLPVDVFCSFLSNKPMPLVTPKGNEKTEEEIEKEEELQEEKPLTEERFTNATLSDPFA